MEFILLFIVIHFFFFWALKTKNYGVMDIGWGVCFITIALGTISSLDLKSFVVFICILLWGVRLSLYLFKRNHGKPEDFRYQELREEWQPHSNRSAYFKVFLFQGVLSFIISLPVWTSLKFHTSYSLSTLVIGVIVFLFGFLWETWADFTLMKFKKNKDNQSFVCEDGPWRYSRHPNYFGEITLWWGVFIICFDLNYWWTIIGPITIHLLILFLSGVPMLEAKMKKNPKYLDYIKTTNSLIPRFFSFRK